MFSWPRSTCTLYIAPNQKCPGSVPQRTPYSFTSRTAGELVILNTGDPLSPPAALAPTLRTATPDAGAREEDQLRRTPHERALPRVWLR